MTSKLKDCKQTLDYHIFELNMNIENKILQHVNFYEFLATCDRYTDQD